MSESIVLFKRLDNQSLKLNRKIWSDVRERNFPYIYKLAVWRSIQNFYSHFTKVNRKCECFGRSVEPSPRFLCRQTFFSPTCWRRGTSESSTYGKQRIFPCNSALAHFQVSWLSDFIFYPKPLYKSLHQSFLYSFIIILPSESGVTLHYCTILP
jgi:hypothetical protein